MFVPYLQLPARQELDTPWAVEHRVEAITNWLSQLPLANPFAALRDIIDYLARLNRSQFPAKRRFSLTQALTPTVASLVPLIRKEYLDAQLPLTDRKRQRHDLVLTAWRETAIAYKTVLMDLILTEKEVLDPKEILIPALAECMDALIEQLVEHYAIYAPDPHNVWGELHQVFHYGRVHAIDEIAIAAGRGRPGNVTLGQTYRRVLLLALADPFHLMPGEAIRLAADLGDLSAQCNLTPAASGHGEEGAFWVAVHVDSGPMYRDPATATTPLPKEALLVDVRPVAEAIRKRLSEGSARALATHATQTTLEQRQYREMYLRVAHALGARGPRRSARTPTAEQRVVMTSGLSAAHHFASGEAPFDPEATEPKLAYLGSSAPVVHTELQLQRSSPASKPTGAEVTPTINELLGNEEDVWARPFRAAQTVSQSPFDHSPLEHHYFTCTVTDSSQGGFALSFSPEQGALRTRVGDLLAIKHVSGAQAIDTAPPWRVCAVRWLRSSIAAVDLGVAVIAEDALAVATRAIDGVGKGGQYQRALIVPRGGLTAAEATLIAAPAIYDAGTVLKVNTERALVHLRLIKLVEATGSYARFTYRVLENFSTGSSRS
jgi:hypothetical protein